MKLAVPIATLTPAFSSVMFADQLPRLRWRETVLHAEVAGRHGEARFS